MMEDTPSTDFRTLALLCRQVKLENGEKNCLGLQRQLDLLKNSLKSNVILLDVEPYDIHTAEFFSWIFDMLKDDQNILIKKKFLDILQIFLADNDIKDILLSQYPVISVLSQCLMNAFQQKEENSTIQCFNMLVNTTQDLDPHCSNIYVPNLLEFLMNQILRNCSTPIFETSICLLRNLCKSEIVKNKIKSVNEFKSFCKVLLRQLPVTNYLISSSSLSILESVLLNDPLGTSLFGEQAIQKTFHLIMSILLKTLENFDALKISVDVIVSILNSESHRNIIIKVYPNFKETLQTLFRALENIKDKRCLDMIMKFVTVMWKEPSSRKIVSYCGSNQCCCVHLINIICQAINNMDDIFEQQLSYLFPLLFMLIQHSLQSCKLNEPVVKSIQKILSKKISWNFKSVFRSHKTCSLLYEYLCLIHPNQTIYDFKAEVCGNESLIKDVFSWFLRNNTLLDDIKLKDLGLKIVFAFINIIESLQNWHNPSQNIFEEILKDDKMIPYFVLALKCNDANIIETILRYLPNISRIHQNKFIGALFQANDKVKIWLKEPQHNPNSLQLNQNNDHQSSFIESKANVQSMIEKIDHMKLKDSKLSEIIEVYEAKFNQMKLDRAQLQEVLKSKTNDVQHLEQLNDQYRCSLAQNEAENMKFRSILKNSELRFEESEQKASEVKLKVKELLVEKESNEASLKQLQRQIQKQNENTDQLNQRLEGMQKRYENAQFDYQSLTDKNIEQQRMIEKLKQKIDEQLVQMESLNLEKDSSRKECLEKESLIQEMNVQHQAIVQQKKDLELQTENFATLNEKLKDEVSCIELKRKKLQQEINEYDVLYQQVVAKGTEQESTIKNLEEKLKKEQEITKMIHSLTGKIKSES